MPQSDYFIQHTNSDRTIHFISAKTDRSQPNNKFEAHTHYNEFEIYHFLKGNLFLFLEGKRYNVQEGSMIIICNGLLHKPVIKAPCRYLRNRVLFDKKIFFNSNLSSFSLYNFLRNRKFIVIAAETVQTMQLDILLNQIGHSLSQNTAYDDFCALISLFSLLIKSEEICRQNDNVSISLNHKKISDIVEYIEENLSEDLNYKIISKAFFVTEKYLYKLFKKETGFTLSNYISERRIIKALSILNAGGTAYEAALNSGFNNYSVFYRSFLRKTGISPAEYIRDITKE